MCSLTGMFVLPNLMSHVSSAAFAQACSYTLIKHYQLLTRGLKAQKGLSFLGQGPQIFTLPNLELTFASYLSNILTYLPCSPHATQRHFSYHRVQLSFSKFRLDVKTLLYMNFPAILEHSIA